MRSVIGDKGLMNMPVESVPFSVSTHGLPLSFHWAELDHLGQCELQRILGSILAGHIALPPKVGLASRMKGNLDIGKVPGTLLSAELSVATVGEAQTPSEASAGVRVGALASHQLQGPRHWQVGPQPKEAEPRPGGPAWGRPAGSGWICFLSHTRGLCAPGLWGLCFHGDRCSSLSHPLGLESLWPPEQGTMGAGEGNCPSRLLLGAPPHTYTPSAKEGK